MVPLGKLMIGVKKCLLSETLQDDDPTCTYIASNYVQDLSIDMGVLVGYSITRLDLLGMIHLRV